MRHLTAAGIAAVAIGTLAAGCSSSTYAKPVASSAPTTPPPVVSSSGTATALSLAALSGIPGKALVDGQGRTLYLFEADTNGTSSCSGACAKAWPPYTVTGTPQAGSGLNGGMLATVHRSDGSIQVVYNRHPLYYFAADSHTGDHNGQGVKGFGASWYVVGADGNKIDTS